MRLTHTQQNAEVSIKSTASKHPKSQNAKKRNFLGRSSIKNQSAMEYLMTYGWAILIIAVVLVALFQMGVFNSANFAPKAQPGSCQVFRTTAATSLEGTCNNELPQYVAQFNGASSYVNIASSSLSSLTGITETLWIKPYGIAHGTSSNAYTRMTGFGNTYLQFTVDESSASSIPYVRFITYQIPAWVDIPVTMNYNTWYELAITYDSSTFKVYLNGNEIGSYSSNGLTTGNNDFNIGTDGGTDVFFNGIISNLQVYNTSLSANDVAALYYEGIGGAPQNTQNLVGWWPLNGNANDYSGNNNNGAATNVIYSGSWTSTYSAP